MQLNNKTAVITGCNSGIGLACLELFAKNGCNIFACCRSVNDNFSKIILQFTNKYKVQIIPIFFDLEKPDDIKSGLKKINEHKFNIDILVNNAGYIYNGLVGMTPQKELEKLFQINYYAPISLIQVISRNMIKNKKGSIINIASTTAMDGNIGRSGYAASKSGLIALTKTLAHELGAKNIRVNCIAPGLTDTKMMKNSTDMNLLPSILNNTALNRIALPEEIANVAMFLASDFSSYITAQTSRVDGGMHL